jgi:uncharacterized phage protein gp47/JayE
MSLYTTSRDAILRDFLGRLREAGFTQLDPASGIMLVCGPVIDGLTQVLTEGEALYDQLQVGTATGEGLDRLAALLGLARLRPTRAYSATQEFYVPGGQTWGDAGGTETVAIPAGTLVYNPGRPGVQFRTLEAAVFTKATTQAVVAIEALLSGSLSRAGAETLTAYIHPTLTSSIWTRNQRSIDTGEDLESDDNLRFRIGRRVEELSSPTEEGIRARLLTLPGVRDVAIDSASRGPGTLTITVLSNLSPSSDELLSRAEAEARRVVAAGIALEVRSPQEIPVVVHMVVEPEDPTVSIVEAVRHQVSLRIANLGLDEALEPSDLINAAYLAGAGDAALTYLEIGGEARELVNHRPPSGSRYVLSSLRVDRR